MVCVQRVHKNSQFSVVWVARYRLIWIVPSYPTPNLRHFSCRKHQNFNATSAPLRNLPPPIIFCLSPVLYIPGNIVITFFHRESLLLSFRSRNSTAIFNHTLISYLASNMNVLCNSTHELRKFGIQSFRDKLESGAASFCTEVASNLRTYEWRDDGYNVCFFMLLLYDGI